MPDKQSFQFRIRMMEEASNAIQSLAKVLARDRRSCCLEMGRIPREEAPNDMK